MTYTNLRITMQATTGIITIDRPTAMNALTHETLVELTSAVQALSNDSAVRVIILTGAGEKAFIAGADIKAMHGMDFSASSEFVHAGHSCMNAIETAEKPVIAMVNGFAFGGGMEVALACDFIYAAETAQFALPEVKLGLFPGFGGTQRLTRLAGKARATELIFTGRRLTATEAQTWGIVNRVIASAGLRPAVEALAIEIGNNSPASIRLAKKAILRGLETGLANGLVFEETIFPACFMTQDRTEGLAAFVEKRPAKFVGK